MSDLTEVCEICGSKADLWKPGRCRRCSMSEAGLDETSGDE